MNAMYTDKNTYDWDIFSSGKKQNREHTSGMDEGRWVDAVEKAIRTIMSDGDIRKMTHSTKEQVLRKVAEVLEIQIPDQQRYELDPSSLAGWVKEKNVKAIEEYFADVADKDYTIVRKEIHGFITGHELPEDEFWFLAITLLELYPMVFRRIIADAVHDMGDVSKYTRDHESIEKASWLMVGGNEKIHQTFNFFVPFREHIPDEIRDILRTSADRLQETEQFDKLFYICNCDISDKLYLLCGTKSTSCIYMGVEILVEFMNEHGREATEAIPFFSYYLNCLEGSFARKLAGELIRQIVLQDSEFLTHDQAIRLLEGGYRAFFEAVNQQNAKDEVERKRKEVDRLKGETIEFMISTTNRLNILGTTRDGFYCILPRHFADKQIIKRASDNNEWISARVVRTVKRPTLLILSQIHIHAKEAARINLIQPGELVEVRFKRSGNDFIPDIKGYGPLKATVVKYPVRFNYKIKHTAKVTKVIDIAHCEIEVL